MATRRKGESKVEFNERLANERLAEWEKKLVTAMKKVQEYRKKVRYYDRKRQRANEAERERLERLRVRGRAYE